MYLFTYLLIIEVSLRYDVLLVSRVHNLVFVYIAKRSPQHV